MAENAKIQRRDPFEWLGAAVVGLYAWMVTCFFGAVLLDVAYANSLREVLGSRGAAVFSAISDVLLLVGLVTLLAALGAVAAGWRSSGARVFLVASLLVLAAEFAVPVFLAGTIQNGWWLRLAINGMASALALAGLYRFMRDGRREG